MTFTKLWKTFLNSCFKEMANKKTKWKGSQSLNSIGISSRGFIHSNVSKKHIASLSDIDCKKLKCSLQEHDHIVKSEKIGDRDLNFSISIEAILKPLYSQKR